MIGLLYDTWGGEKLDKTTESSLTNLKLGINRVVSDVSPIAIDIDDNHKIVGYVNAPQVAYSKYGCMRGKSCLCILTNADKFVKCEMPTQKLTDDFAITKKELHLVYLTRIEEDVKLCNQKQSCQIS
jgi:hypothetical protein